jgi:hypothetical protein
MLENEDLLENEDPYAGNLRPKYFFQKLIWLN